MVVLWPVLGAEMQKNQKISKFLKKIIEKIQIFWHKNLKFLEFFLSWKIENFNFFFIFFFFSKI